MERTLVVIKPDGVQKKLIGYVVGRFELAGLRIVSLYSSRFTLAEAKEFYKIHEGKPFYEDLCEFMSSGPIVVIILEGEKAISRVREIMGATDSSKASPGTIRGKFGDRNVIRYNIVHGSDSVEAACREIDFCIGIHGRNNK